MWQPNQRYPVRDYAGYRQIFTGVRMLFAYVDRDLLADNIRQVLARNGDKQIRLASKSLRSVPIVCSILAADMRFQGIMCYSAREAVWLARQGFSDLLIGYPVWHPEDLAEVAWATRDGAAITLRVDSIEHVAHIDAIAQDYAVTLPLCWAC